MCRVRVEITLPRSRRITSRTLLFLKTELERGVGGLAAEAVFSYDESTRVRSKEPFPCSAKVYAALSPDGEESIAASIRDIFTAQLRKIAVKPELQCLFLGSPVRR